MLDREKKKIKTKAKKQAKLLLKLAFLVVGACALIAFNVYTSIGGEIDDNMGMGVSKPVPELWSKTGLVEEHRRKLADDDENAECVEDGQPSICVGYSKGVCKKLDKEDTWILLFIVLFLLYLFVGIAIVCDELFVPALEIIAEKFDLSNDVAGATLMAAGGSAPELATSFVGTFKRSDVGFGTIVGSAVFNVLFVIGCCVLFTPEKFAPLELTWWPLFRDCSYYVITLATLAIFMVDGEIALWESVIQLLLYFLYVYMMSHNEQLEAWVKSMAPAKTAPTENLIPQDEASADNSEKGVPKLDIKETTEVEKYEIKDETSTSFNKPSTFRVGILQLLLSNEDISHTAGIAFVSKIKGDVNEVFARIDKNNNGEIDHDELKLCLAELGTPEEELTEAKIATIMKVIDKSGNGHANKDDFTKWYIGNEQRLKNTHREIFDKYATEGQISKKDIQEYMEELGHNRKDIQIAIESAVSDLQGKQNEDMLTYDEFAAWYEASLFWEQEKHQAHLAEEAQESMLDSLINGFNDIFDPEISVATKSMFLLTMPLTALFCTIPDCRPPGREEYAPFTLIGSIIMIALFAIIMVELAEIFGATIGIPEVVMGLTVLAAGTSVPDLLSSVIVARQGLGDMAVSSSIGSNIFDVSFGLPLPWLVFNIITAIEGCNCGVVAKGKPAALFQSLLILLLMVAAIIVIIWYFDWKMTHNLGYAMFILYFVYLGIALGVTTPKDEYKSEECSGFKLF